MSASPSPVPAATSAMFPRRATPACSTTRDDGGSPSIPWPAASRSFSSFARFAPTRSASVASSSLHGRFVASHRPSTTGPATPRHAASIDPDGPPARNRSIAVSSVGNSWLVSTCSRTTASAPPCSAKSASTVFVPPTSPARITSPSSLAAGRPLDVAAELLPHRRQHLLGEGVVLAGAEARVEGGREHVGRDALLDRRHDRPPALARVVDGARVIGERGVLDERLRGEVEQPGAHHRAAPPHLGDVGDVQLVALVGLERLGVGVLQDVEPLRVRLHHAVFDPVVDHLHEVAGPRGPTVEIALLDRPH